MVGKREIITNLETTENDLEWLYKHFSDIWNGNIEGLKLVDRISNLILNMNTRLYLLRGALEYDVNKKNTNSKISREVDKEMELIRKLNFKFFGVIKND